MPDDKNIAWTNTMGMGVILAVVYAGAFVLFSFSPSLFEIVLACLGLTLVAVVFISFYNKQLVESASARMWTTRATVGLALALVGGVILQSVITASTPMPKSATAATTTAAAAGHVANSPQCLAAISQGHWVETRCDSTPTSTSSKKQQQLPQTAYCQTSQWVWDANGKCPISKKSTATLRSVYKGKKVLFAGDSEVRNVYHQFISLLEPDYVQNKTALIKHSDLHYQPAFSKDASVDFVWAPLASNLTAVVQSHLHSGNYRLIVLGVAAWDALHGRDINAYSNNLKSLAVEISSNSMYLNTTKLVWMQPTTIVSDNLVTEEKRRYMNEEVMQQHRAAFLASPAAGLFDTVIDGTQASRGKRSQPVDGIHYSEDVYEVLAHMVSNGYTAHFASQPSSSGAHKKPYAPRPTGSMSFPTLGALALGLAAIMLFTMDSFLGIGYLSLVLFGRSYDWEAGYANMNRKIHAEIELAEARENAAGSGDAVNDAL